MNRQLKNMEKFKEITSFKQIKAIIEPIPAELFQTSQFGHDPGGVFGDNREKEDNGKSCFIGHINRYFKPEDKRANHDWNGYGARQLTAKMLRDLHNYWGDGADVNNSSDINGYTEPVIKDRLMHMIEDGIKWEESRKL